MNRCPTCGELFDSAQHTGGFHCPYRKAAVSVRKMKMVPAEELAAALARAASAEAQVERLKAERDLLRNMIVYFTPDAAQEPDHAP